MIERRSGTAGLPQACSEFVLRRLPLFSEFTEEECRAIESTRTAIRHYGPGSSLYFEGDPANEAFTLLDGWAFGFHEFADGRRQILDIYLPGDSIGVQPGMARPMDHSAQTLTHASLCVFQQRDLRRLFADYANLSQRSSRLIAHERTLLYEHITSLGRRSPLERLGYFLLELFVRMEERQMTDADSAPFPLRQAEIADALGLTSAHISRLLGRLRKAGLISVSGGWLRLHDREGLSQLSGLRSRFQAKTPPL